MQTTAEGFRVSASSLESGAGVSTVKEVFDEHGVVLIERLFDAARIEKLFRQIDSLMSTALAGQGEDPARFDGVDAKYSFLKKTHPKIKSHVYDLIPYVDGLKELSISPSLVGFVKSVLGDPVLIDHPQIRIDDQSDDRLLPFHQEVFGQISEACLTAWCPLVDVTLGSGALRIVPGSHRRGAVPHKFHPEHHDYHGIAEEVAADEVIHVTAQAGDAVVFHPLLFHGSSPNQSPDVRWTFVVRYNGVDAAPYLADEHAPMRIVQR